MDGDLKPFKYGSEGTHYACQCGINKEGGQARCCGCVPHSYCKSQESKKSWQDRFDKKFHGYWLGQAIPDEIKFFFEKVIEEEKEKLLYQLRNN